MKHGSARTWLPLAALFAGAPLMSGCYNYTLMPVESAPVGEKVRVVTTRQGASQLISMMDIQGAAPTIQGTLEGVDDGNLVMRVPLPSDPDGVASLVELGQVVRVPQGEVLSLELQSFSAAKTGLFVGASAAVAAGLIVLILDATGGDTDNPDPDPDVLFNLLRIPIG